MTDTSIRYGDWVDLDQAANVRSLGLRAGDQFEASTGLIWTIADDPEMMTSPRGTAYRLSPTRVTRRYRRCWEIFQHPYPNAGSLGLRPGDQFERYSSGTLCTVAADGVHFAGEQTWRLDDFAAMAVLRRDVHGPGPDPAGRSTTGAAASARFRPPRITRVVCDACGRDLDEWSDGTTPRSRRGECCTNVPRMYGADDEGLYLRARPSTSPDAGLGEDEYEEEEVRDEY